MDFKRDLSWEVKNAREVFRLPGYEFSDGNRSGTIQLTMRHFVHFAVDLFQRRFFRRPNLSRFVDPAAKIGPTQGKTLLHQVEMKFRSVLSLNLLFGVIQVFSVPTVLDFNMSADGHPE